jgi:HEAT repeat protein
MMLGAGAALALALGGVWATRGAPPEAPAGAAPGEVAAPPAPDLSSHRWRASGEDGWRRPRLDGAYRVSYTMTLGPRGAPPNMRVQLEADLEVSADPSGPDGWSAAVARDARLVLDEGARAQMSDLPPARAEEAFAVSMRASHDARGRLGEVLFASHTPQSARATWLGLLGFAQLVEPAQGAPDGEWTTSERDANTSYEATYALVGADQVRKTWESAPPPGQPRLYTSRGEATFTLDDARHLSDLDLTHTAYVDVSGSGELVLEVSTRASFMRVDAADPDALAAVPREGMAPYDAARHLPMTREQRDQAMVAGRTFDQIDEELRTHSASGNWQLRTATRRDLAASMRLNPAQVDLVADRLSQGVEPEPLRRSYIEALASVPTEGASSRLLGLSADRDLPDDLRVQTTQAMSLMSHPSEDLVRGLIALANSQNARDRGVADTALVSAGAAARHLGSTSPQGSQQIIDELVAAADKRITDEELAREFGVDQGDGSAEYRVVNWLQALGNTHSEAALPTLVRATNARSSWIRKAAYDAMRGLPGEVPGQLVSQAILEDPHPSVRRVALQAARSMGPERCKDATSKALTDDPRDLVRMEAANTIGSWMLDDPDLATLLEAALPAEEELYIRDAMRNYMRRDPRLVERPFTPTPID